MSARCSKCGATETEVFVLPSRRGSQIRLRVPYVDGLSEAMIDARNKVLMDGCHPLTFVLGWQTYVSWLHELGCHANLHTSPVTREDNGSVTSFMGVPVAVDQELRCGVRVLVRQGESVAYANHERRKFGAIAVVLDEEERQMLLKALADLSRTNPGWDDALNRIALRVDNDHRGRAEMYDGFRQLSRARPPTLEVLKQRAGEPTTEWAPEAMVPLQGVVASVPQRFFESAAYPNVVVGVDLAVGTGGDCTAVSVFDRTAGGVLQLRESITWKGQEVRVGDGAGGYVDVDLAPLKGAELDAFAEKHGVMSREEIREANRQMLPRGIHGLDADEQYRWRVMQALRAAYVSSRKLLAGR